MIKKICICTIFPLIAFLSSCESNSNSNTGSEDDSYLLKGTAIVVYKADSVDPTIVKELLMDDKKCLIIRKDTQIIAEDDDNDKFNPSNVDDVNPGDRVDYYYYANDVDYKANPVTYSLTKLTDYLSTETNSISN